jgi:hypothetical protein
MDFMQMPRQIWNFLNVLWKLHRAKNYATIENKFYSKNVALCDVIHVGPNEEHVISKDDIRHVTFKFLLPNLSFKIDNTFKAPNNVHLPTVTTIFGSHMYFSWHKGTSEKRSPVNNDHKFGVPRVVVVHIYVNSKSTTF